LSFKVQFGPLSTLMNTAKLMCKASSFGAFGPTASCGADGDLIVTGPSGRGVETATGMRAFAGLAPDLFAGDAMALGEFRTALFEKERFDPGAFQSGNDLPIHENAAKIWRLQILHGRLLSPTSPRHTSTLPTQAVRFARSVLRGMPGNGLRLSSDMG
jgi:hypothetical protein